MGIYWYCTPREHLGGLTGASPKSLLWQRHAIILYDTLLGTLLGENFAYLNCFTQLSMSLTVALKPFYKGPSGGCCESEGWEELQSRVCPSDRPGGTLDLPLSLKSFHNISTKGGHLLVLYSKRKSGRPHRGLSQISFVATSCNNTL